VDIRLFGVSTHNLRGIDVRIPWGSICAVAGVSGSGKSSLAHDTLFVEGQLRYLETVSHRMPFGGRWIRPRLRWAENISPAVAVGQKGPSWADATGIADALNVTHHMRYWFAHQAEVVCPDCGLPVSASDAADVVAACEKFPEGSRIRILAPFSRELDEDLRRDLLETGFTRLLEKDREIELEEGQRPSGPDFDVVVDRVILRRGTDSRIAGSVEQAFRLSGGRVRIRTQDMMQEFSTRPRCTCGREFPRKSPRLFSRDPVHGGGCPVCEGARIVDGTACRTCGGTGFSRDLEAYRIDKASWLEWMHFSFAQAAARCEAMESHADTAAGSLLAPLLRILRLACEFYLGDMPLLRPVNTLSRGEAQYVRLAAQLSGDLSGVTVILDEPGQGLDPEKRRGLLPVLRRLAARMNTVILVEHDPDIIAGCDWVVELGPQAGEHGGRLIFEGPPSELAKSAESILAPWMHRRDFPPPVLRGTPEGFVETPALQSGDLDFGPARFPLRRWSVLTGPTACGKTRFLSEVFAQHHRLISADGIHSARKFPGGVRLVQERTFPRTPHSHVASLCGIWDFLRRWYAQLPLAKARGYDASRFSTTRAHDGRCLKCGGLGEILVETGGASQVALTCPACEGRRFSPSTLEIRWRGFSIADILEHSVSDALTLFAHFPEIAPKLQLLVETNLGYLKLGQPSRSLSGGELQRLLLAQNLLENRESCFLLDDPASGLHPEDAVHLIRLFQRLSDEGHTLITTDHTGFLAASADARVAIGRNGRQVRFVSLP